MSKAQYETRPEDIKLNRIKRIYDSVLLTENNSELRSELISELLTIQNQDGSWAVIDTDKFDLDFAIQYILFPTYYATASLIFADTHERYSEESFERQSLIFGLQVAEKFKLMGHGFDATRQMLDALIIYKNAGIYSWINEKRNAQISFCDIIHEKIAIMKENIRTGNTVSDWAIDFQEDYKREIIDYDALGNTYVWYACYGSNINKSRFIKYINNCSDNTPPTDDRPYCFNHNIYFAKIARAWNFGGKAFLDNTTPGFAYGRIYKITKAQFEEIRLVEGADYSKRLFLEYIDNIPVYTLTDTQKNENIKVPSSTYYEVIFEGLKECYAGIISNNELNKYLVNTIFPCNTFEVAKIIKENPHCITISTIAENNDLCTTDITESVTWLREHQVIKQDTRSIREGHTVTDPQAYFYTVNGYCGRKLLEAILKNHQEESDEIQRESKTALTSNPEGERHFVLASRVERSRQNRINAIRLHGYKCQVCGFDFAKTYGDLGKNYIEVHHVNPLAEQNCEHIVNPETDLVCLCANCHRMIHRDRNNVLSISELKKIISH